MRSDLNLIMVLTDIGLMRNESGFTLIELLTVVGIISICSLLGMTSFYEYRGDAAYAVAERTVADAINAVEAAVTAPDIVLPSVAGYSQSSPGAIADSSAVQVLPGFMVPRKTRFEVSYNPTCLDASCEQTAVEVRHCHGRDYVRWLKYGDGVAVRLEHLAGVGCS